MNDPKSFDLCVPGGKFFLLEAYGTVTELAVVTPPGEDYDCWVVRFDGFYHDYRRKLRRKYFSRNFFYLGPEAYQMNEIIASKEGVEFRVVSYFLDSFWLDLNVEGPDGDVVSMTGRGAKLLGRPYYSTAE